MNQVTRNAMRQRTSETEDEADFVTLAELYQRSNPALATELGGCSDKAPSGVVRGAEIEENPGALMDYVYYKHNTFMVSTGDGFLKNLQVHKGS